jgi:hypothetical protein
MIHLGTDYARTTDSNVYRFVTKRIIATPLPLSFFHRNAAFCDGSGRVWATIEEGILYISQGYAWNGCSPKRKVLGVWLGTPDTASNVHASLGHDVLFQFSATKHFKLTFEQVNGLFRSLMRKDRFPLSEMYYQAVMGFGLDFWQKDKSVHSKAL